MRWQVFRVDRRRWRAAYPVTFLTAPAGLRRVQLRMAGRGETVMAQMDIEVHPGRWRQLTVGQGAYPLPIFDERGVNVNTVTRSRRRSVVLGLLGFLVLFGGFAAACLTGPRLLDWLGV